MRSFQILTPATKALRSSLIRPTTTQHFARRWASRDTMIVSGPSYWTVGDHVCPFGEASFIHDPTGELYSSVRFDKNGPAPRICMVWDKQELNVMPGSISFYAYDSGAREENPKLSGEVDWV